MKPYNQTQSKRDQIRDMFNRIATAYDMLNHLLSLGIDRCWRRSLVKLLAQEHPKKVIDVATGTGDLAIAIAQSMRETEIQAVDLSAQMLDVARTKIENKPWADHIELSVAEAENLEFEDQSFDAATAAFGVRNFHNIELGLEQMHRVLKVGGKIFVLEFSTPENKIFGVLYRFYFHKVLPTVGGLLSKDRKAYKYLPDSVDEFPDKERFLEILSSVGFSDCKAVALLNGVAYIYIGIK